MHPTVSGTEAGATLFRQSLHQPALFQQLSIGGGGIEVIAGGGEMPFREEFLVVFLANTKIVLLSIVVVFVVVNQRPATAEHF